MFSRMIEQLRRGEEPPAADLAALVKVALVKKQGVLQQPPACWTGDPKINPDSGHLLWAAVILGLEEEIHAAAGMLMAEMAARPGKTDQAPGQVLAGKLAELADLATTSELAGYLNVRIARARELLGV